MRRIFVSIILLAPTVWFLHASAAVAGGKSDSKVKTSATATRIDADGKQVLTVTLDIEKGWYLYARPVNLKFGGVPEDWGELFDIVVRAKDKLTTDIKYPPGNTFVIGSGRSKTQYDTYEGRLVVKVIVQRTNGDVSPLNVAIYVDATDRKMFCILPGVIRLTVPQE